MVASMVGSEIRFRGFGKKDAGGASPLYTRSTKPRIKTASRSESFSSIVYGGARLSSSDGQIRDGTEASFCASCVVTSQEEKFPQNFQ